MRLSNTEEVALVDEDDFQRVLAMGNWYKSDSGYAVRRYKNSTLRMHRFIRGTPRGLHTDHINGNRLDNRKVNLRAVSEAVNAWNKTVENPHKVYKGLPRGVTFDYDREKYYATKVIRRRFSTLEEAIKFTQESEEI